MERNQCRNVTMKHGENHDGCEVNQSHSSQHHCSFLIIKDTGNATIAENISMKEIFRICRRKQTIKRKLVLTFLLAFLVKAATHFLMLHSKLVLF